MAASAPPTGPYRNVILRKLAPDVLAQLSLTPVELEFRESVYEADTPIEYAYFPESGVLSVAAVMDDGSTIENGTIGREGMLGSVLLLNAESTPYRCFVQVEGFGYRVDADRLVDVARESESLRNRILRYESGFRIQIMQGIACNGLHNVEKRCCRWLLMTRDRVDSDDLKLTHEFLGVMLGVRRASVSDVLAPLQAAGVVESCRGKLTILDRKALEARVCECYWVMAEREREAASL